MIIFLPLLYTNWFIILVKKEALLDVVGEEKVIFIILYLGLRKKKAWGLLITVSISVNISKVTFGDL